MRVFAGYHHQDYATLYWDMSMNGYTSYNTFYEPYHMDGEMYIPYLVGSAVNSSLGYFNNISYATYPGFFVGYAYAYGAYSQRQVSAHLPWAMYSYVGQDGYKEDRSTYSRAVIDYHTTRITFIGSIH